MRKTKDPRTPRKIAIPAETIPLLTAGVINEIGEIASRIAEITETGGKSERQNLPEVFAELDEFRILLSATSSAERKGWPDLELNVDTYGDVLTQTIEGELTAHRELLNIDPGTDGADQQREKAQQSIDLLQALHNNITSHTDNEQDTQE